MDDGHVYDSTTELVRDGDVTGTALTIIVDGAPVMVLVHLDGYTRGAQRGWEEVFHERYGPHVGVWVLTT